MDTPKPLGAGADPLPLAAGPEVFTNANTITGWLLAQPKESQLQ